MLNPSKARSEYRSAVRRAIFNSLPSHKNNYLTSMSHSPPAKGPRWPKGKVSGLRPVGSRFETDFTEDPPCIEPIARQIIRSGQTPSHWCGVEVWRGSAPSGVALIK
ncbi:hypothetical protein AVEN_98628-1 [Araneus ventricosus]|uniref:Uncharacterized protein n=1 Tax=Araneus ventricosus TaxID=182803 RepID=A0A4Y2TXP9_ARAVE|nr:hypothetical protein AVEN_98628-1 [Araneus ventricosus]